MKAKLQRLFRRIFPRWKEIYHDTVTIRYEAKPRVEVETIIGERNASGETRWFVEKYGMRMRIKDDAINPEWIKENVKT